MIFAMRCFDDTTRAMLQRAWTEDGPDREAMQETHGQVSVDRAPHQELRKHYATEAA